MKILPTNLFKAFAHPIFHSFRPNSPSTANSAFCWLGPTKVCPMVGRIGLPGLCFCRDSKWPTFVEYEWGRIGKGIGHSKCITKEKIARGVGQNGKGHRIWGRRSNGHKSSIMAKRELTLKCANFEGDALVGFDWIAPIPGPFLGMPNGWPSPFGPFRPRPPWAGNSFRPKPCFFGPGHTILAYRRIPFTSIGTAFSSSWPIK